MAAWRASGHGNFAFVKDASALAGFLKREARRDGDTTIENATCSSTFRRASARTIHRRRRAVGSLRLGDLAYGLDVRGDERRAIVELDGRWASPRFSASMATGVDAHRRRAGAGDLTDLSLAGVSDLAEVNASRDGRCCERDERVKRRSSSSRRPG